MLPQFIDYPPVRQVNDSRLGKVLSDIESHMPKGHPYYDDDKITHGHETSHGIAANVRMGKTPKANGFYVLRNRAVLVDEPATTIREVAKLVPMSLRGRVYKLYLVDQARQIYARAVQKAQRIALAEGIDTGIVVENPWGQAYHIYTAEEERYGNWNNRPLYLFDEFTAYANGSEVRLDLGITSRSETVAYMLEFSVYCLCVAWSARPTDPQFIAFLRWQLARARTLYYVSENLGKNPLADKYLETMRKSADAEEFRAFVRDYLGAVWVKSVLEF